jgi:dihydropteroate synthase
MLWKVRNRTFDLSKNALLMGVLNVTPDSFSDGGRWRQARDAVQQGLKMARAGADILDVGGESSRPGATPVSAQEELERILPVLETLAKETTATLCVDTQKPEVAKEALRAGACIVNDIGGLQNPAMREVLLQSGAGGIAMHMQGSPATMQNAPAYLDVVEEVRGYLREALWQCEQAGIPADCIVLDPGIGFGKTADHNRLLLRELNQLRQLQRPILIGVSRKSFLSAISGKPDIQDRFWPTVALTSYARFCNASIFRVHDVCANLQALRDSESLLEACA